MAAHKSQYEDQSMAHKSEYRSIAWTSFLIQIRDATKRGTHHFLPHCRVPTGRTALRRARLVQYVRACRSRAHTPPSWLQVHIQDIVIRPALHARDLLRCDRVPVRFRIAARGPGSDLALWVDGSDDHARHRQRGRRGHKSDRG